MSSIIEMPVLVMEKIIEFSDFKAVLTLRQVCRDFRNFIDVLRDSKLPDSAIKAIVIVSDYEEDDSKITMDFLFSDNHFDSFEYSEMEHSRTFETKENPERRTTTDLGDSNIVDVAIRDLEWILKFQKSDLNGSYFYFDDFRLHNDSSIYTLPIKVSNMLNVSGRKIKTRELSITTYNKSNNIMSVLPFADSETLTSLDLIPLEEGIIIIDEIAEIAKTEQWKATKELKCDFCLMNLNVEDICHFSRMKIKIPSITARDLDFLKKTYISSSKFVHAFFDLGCFNDIEEISDLWGPAFTPGLSKHFWYFRRKNSDEKVLRIEFYRNIEAFIFEIVESKDVPNGAVIHDYNGN
ncbi:hypothetical protein B9Z55_021228 [Caenorhabditis nigoni]|uniref:F-box domain-containing protein n=1 Tax=Caenorhabditis nigoni TaxID=1611254 RepID=A0A2G5TRM3_9PELO|nr:hypothetical protein B9Z55_021228 [Caenorhabditis nigoni]